METYALHTPWLASRYELPSNMTTSPRNIDIRIPLQAGTSNHVNITQAMAGPGVAGRSYATQGQSPQRYALLSGQIQSQQTTQDVVGADVSVQPDTSIEAEMTHVWQEHQPPIPQIVVSPPDDKPQKSPELVVQNEPVPTPITCSESRQSHKQLDLKSIPAEDILYLAIAHNSNDLAAMFETSSDAIQTYIDRNIKREATCTSRPCKEVKAWFDISRVTNSVISASTYDSICRSQQPKRATRGAKAAKSSGSGLDTPSKSGKQAAKVTKIYASKESWVWWLCNKAAAVLVQMSQTPEAPAGE